MSLVAAPWYDRVFVKLAGGVRIRLGGDGAASVVGQIAGPPPVRLVDIVRDLARGKRGRVHLWRDGHGHWRIASGGELSSPAFEQRLRNTLAVT